MVEAVAFMFTGLLLLLVLFVYLIIMTLLVKLAFKILSPARIKTQPRHRALPDEV